jgi:pentatricopeptide repeat protein
MKKRKREFTEDGTRILYVTHIPDRPKWNKHINNCVESGSMDEAMDAARCMMNLGIEPNVKTFNTLVKG